jgi:hypothetical protein
VIALKLAGIPRSTFYYWVKQCDKPDVYFFGVLPLLLVFMVLLLLLTNRWAFKIEKLSLGAFNLLFDNPAKLYKRTVRSFLF